VTLVQETEQDVQAGFLTYVPVYAHDRPHSSGEPRGALQGYVYSPFRISNLIRGIFPDPLDDIDLEIFDGTRVVSSALMYAGDESGRALERQDTPMFSSQQTIALYGHEWTLAFATLPPFASAAEQFQPWGILVVGIIISLLAFLFVRAQENTRGRALALAQEMTSVLRKRQEELRTSEAMWHGLVNANPESVYLMDAAGQILAANETVAQRLGTDVQAMIGANLFDLLPPTVATARRARIDEVVASGKPIRFEDVRAGRLIDNYVHPISNSDDRLTRLAVLGIDITERRQAEEETRTLNRELEQRVIQRTAQLEAARDEAEQANRAKSEFLSRMSHELRTPLNAILGFAQLLGMDHLDDDQREDVDHITRAGRHLLDLINEVLNISRIETGQLALSLEPVNVSEIVTDAISLVGPLGAESGVGLRSELPDGEWHILADLQRMRQVLLNLLGNAVKYSRSGATATVGANRVEGGRIRITVQNSGPGIAPELLSRLFMPFDRIGAEATAVEGTGLGLSLSKALVEAMGGTIGVESTVGVGSRFWVELPETELVAARPEATADLDEEPAAGAAAAGTVLYVEDNISNFRLVERVLALRGEVRLIPAMLGGLGLDLAREHRPDLVLLDLHLPDMNGEELLGRLRADPATRHIPVVVLSADATPGQVEQLLAAGARAYLTKPLDIGKLLAL
ncbi:MAG: ATP-binding protein, partial [Planctomycetota bacterium]